MSTQRAFYHPDTEKKLKVVEEYLEGFLKVMTSLPRIQSIYVDAFAGSGSIPASMKGGLLDGVIDADELAVGSAVRAAGLKRKFSRYVFIEADPKKLAELKEKIGSLEDPPKNVEYRRGDANTELLELCPSLSKPNVRSVVFLDPFGNQVKWNTLEALARTEHVDLWYLFPAMLGVYRQIGNQGAKMTFEQERSLDDLFGPHDWRKAFIGKSPQPDLFSNIEANAKIADVNDITRFQIECLRGIFKGGVPDKWLPLGRNKCHWYSLIFAMANPSPKAMGAGHRIANHILTHS